MLGSVSGFGFSVEASLAAFADKLAMSVTI
jgi:hypothetical protein